jgi:acetolactate synthase I/II/III large subunit
VSGPRTGGQLLADQLVVQGCELAFCVPGESYLPLLDGLYAHRDAVRVVTCRHETAAANAADAYGKLTGRPGVCMVTRGPGATQAAVGIHTARQDSTPLVLLVGQVASAHRGREAFQEIDCTAVFGSMAKDVFELDDAARIPEIVAAAFSLAASGRQGPVVIACPEDVLSAIADVTDGPRHAARRPRADPVAIGRLRALLQDAERPLVLVGGGPWDAASCAHLAEWATACGLPVAASFRRQDLVDNALAGYVGDVGLGVNPRLAQRIRDADLLIAVGPRLTETETQGYTLPAPPVAPQTLVHVHPDPSELGRV